MSVGEKKGSKHLERNRRRDENIPSLYACLIVSHFILDISKKRIEKIENKYTDVYSVTRATCVSRQLDYIVMTAGAVVSPLSFLLYPIAMYRNV